jgi:hypothetical protein
MLVNLVAQELNLGDKKHTFVRINLQTIGLQERKNLLQVLKVLLPGRTRNQNINQVDENKRNTGENLVHHALK